MKTKISLAVGLALAALAVVVALVPRSQPSRSEPLPPDEKITSGPLDSSRPRVVAEASSAQRPVREIAAAPLLEESFNATTNKLDRLNQIRETFRALAAGDPATAMRAAKKLTDETERETALFTLVTEWTQGELGPARRRARLTEAFGIEAGLAVELANKPDLAVLWANELTEGPARTALLQQIGLGLVSSDPAAALALAQQLPETERRQFFDSLFAGWGGADTDAALKYAEQMPDQAARDAALQAIRTAAPVGIGAVLTMQDGYAVINQLMEGHPAAQSGQIHPGDRIVGLAQGDNSFVDASGLPLEQIVKMVRGAPNSMLQLQILAADAPPGSAPRMVSILRDQLKFKR
jgi:hypothetical protein